jgi:hypothetical protein
VGVAGRRTAATGGVGTARQAAANLIRYGVVPGLLSEGAGQAAELYDPNNKALAAGARVAGGLLGAVSGRKITSPLENTGEAAAQRAADVAFLREQGVHPTPGMVADSKPASFYYDELDPSRYKTIRDNFTRAAMRQAGVDGLATVGPDGNIPRVMQEASQRYERAIRGAGDMAVDRRMAQDVLQRLQEVAKPGLYGDDVQNAVSGAARRAFDLQTANGGAIPAREFQTLRSDIAEQARGMGDPRGKRLLYGIANDLDAAMERHLTRAGRDPAAFRDANDYYRRMLTLREAADSAGATTAAGHLAPSNLQRAAEAIYGTDSRMRENNPFARLARAGVSVLGESKSSGTAERAGVKALIAAPGAVLGMLGAGHLADIAGMGEHSALGTLLGLEGAATTVGGLLSKPALRAATDNPIVRRYVGNQLAQDAAPLASVPGLLTAVQATQPPHHVLRGTVYGGRKSDDGR